MQPEQQTTSSLASLMPVIARVAHAESGSFAELASIAGLDPATSFRGADLQRVDFGMDDLTGFDFSGADLRDADLSRVTGLDLAMLAAADLRGAKLPPKDDDDAR